MSTLVLYTRVRRELCQGDRSALKTSSLHCFSVPLCCLCCAALTFTWEGQAPGQVLLGVPCLHLALPGAARWAESPGGGRKLAERRKLFIISCFL